MAVRYYYFQSQSFDLTRVSSQVPAAALTAVVASSPGGTSFLILQSDDVFEEDLLSAMGDQGFTLLFSDLLAPPAFGQSRFYGSLAADPVSPPFPAPAAGDQYFNTVSLSLQVFDGLVWKTAGVDSHSALLAASLVWTASAHTGPAGSPTLAAFDAAGAPVTMSPAAAVPQAVKSIQVNVNGALGNGTQDSTTQLPAGCAVVDAWSDVTVGFSPGTTLTVGTTGTPAAFMDSTAVDPDLDPTAVALYQKSQRTTVAGASVVRVTLGGGPVAGTAVVLVFYVTPDT